MSEIPAAIYAAFASSHAGRHMRKWSTQPFDGAIKYTHVPAVLLPYAPSDQKQRMDAAFEARVSPANSASEAFDIAWREAADAERSETETRFWSIVDSDGLTGLPSDMWAALEILVARAAQEPSNG